MNIQTLTFMLKIILYRKNENRKKTLALTEKTLNTTTKGIFIYIIYFVLFLYCIVRLAQYSRLLYNNMAFRDLFHR